MHDTEVSRLEDAWIDGWGEGVWISINTFWEIVSVGNQVIVVRHMGWIKCMGQEGGKGEGESGGYNTSMVDQGIYTYKMG
jgi:hypothetical protein